MAIMFWLIIKAFPFPLAFEFAFAVVVVGIDAWFVAIANPGEETPMKLVCGGGLLNKASMESLEACGLGFGCDGGFEGVGVIKSKADGVGWDAAGWEAVGWLEGSCDTAKGSG